MFMQGDIVRYIGNKPSLKKTSRGEVLAQMGNEKGVYVVEFETNAYVLSEAELTKDLERVAKAAEVVQKKRHKHSDEE